ncbi:MAG: DedA family protein [Burkholderiales bacterium]|nr:DedA family protein [Burkholderiales bacterium]
MEILNYLIDFFSTYGYFAVFLVLIACGIGVPIPEDITLIAGGVICALSKTTSHLLHSEIMSLVALGGVLIGDGTMFFMGRRLGPKVTRVPVIRRIITEKIYSEIQAKVLKYGDKILFVARFLPGIRAPIYIMAGVSHRVSYLKFIIMDGLAAIISVPLLVYIGYFFANDLDEILHYVKHSEVVIISLASLVVVFIVLYNIRKAKKKKHN